MKFIVGFSFCDSHFESIIVSCIVIIIEEFIIALFYWWSYSVCKLNKFYMDKQEFTSFLVLFKKKIIKTFISFNEICHNLNLV